MFHKLKQFNDLRKQANTLKSKLAVEKITVDNRALSLTMDGNQEVQSVIVKGEYLKPESKTDLEKNIKDAVNDAIKKAQRVMASKIRESGDFKIPGM